MQDEMQNAQIQEEDIGELFRIRREKLEHLKEAGKNPFEITTFAVTDYAQYIVSHYEEKQDTQVCIAGRIMSKRGMGKASFIHVQDTTGKIQAYVRKDAVGDELYEEFKKMDIGDIIGITGIIFQTKTGETTVKASTVTLLSKSLLPLPEKFHGLKDTELRYRQRYVDLIVNPNVKETFEKRSKIIRAIRQFLDEQGFLEVETPVLHTNAGGAAARPFITHHNKSF